MHTIKLYTVLILCLNFIVDTVFSQTIKEPLKYVNPFIGTTYSNMHSEWEGHGKTFPGAVAPFGFIQLSPETRVINSRKYDYEDSCIYYFNCINHHSGYPGGSAGNVYIMPVDTLDNFQLKKYSRHFIHKNEKAEPGYYSVYFSDNGTLVETTASERTGMFRFTFKPHVIPRIFIGDIGIITPKSKRILQGNRYNTIIEFNEAYIDNKDVNDGCILTFSPSVCREKVVLLKFGTSAVSFKSTRKNLGVENAGWNFNNLKEKTQNKWNQELSVIEIEDTCTKNKKIFYSALYHSLLIPWVISDVDGYYKGKDGIIHKTKGGNQYGVFSPWDTFRSLHPLLCLLNPDRQNDMILSMLDIYEQSGQLPKGPMTGNHIIPVIVDSYLKGITNFDKTLAYEAMKKIILTKPFYQNYIKIYDQQGYIPFSFPESVTKTVEYAYNDWALAQFSKQVMHQNKDYDLLTCRSYNYRNLFNSQELFLLPRKTDEFILNPGNFGYKEGNKWIYSLFVPHNIKDIINLMGGDAAFSSHLDSAFENNHLPFDNEPVLFIPYLYNYAKTPYKTQKRVREIMNTHYKSTADGLPGNDDLGAMSSWYVFSAMGFFPVCPGKPVYDIGSPLLKSITINLASGKKFVIEAINSSPQNIYVKSLTVNNKLYNKSWIPHSIIAQGGVMTFEMTPGPDFQWATNTNSIASSETIRDSDFKVTDFSSIRANLLLHQLKSGMKNLSIKELPISSLTLINFRKYL